MLNSSYRAVPPGAAVMSEECGAVAQRLAGGGTLNKTEPHRCQKPFPGNVFGLTRTQSVSYRPRV